MADEELDVLDDVEMLEEEEDNAKALTSGLVIGTTLVLLVAFFMMEKALGAWFAVGPFAP
ncbi:MAG: hypothetical protein VX913_15950 [Planctomycetota bacterium]|nr:hypothetical protein [Planctomycetota bacterium]MEE2714264.1 hypothetical protein [Planctomycetota bacterium]